MLKADVHSYDAIIIGAGIGGLVCGCYLAKAGMKVLIAEQHHTPGGYCTSFRRGKYLFDAAPHCFGSYREDGIMRKILGELDVDRRLSVVRPDPTDMMITPDYQVSFWNNHERTREEFKRISPHEGDRIDEFFHLLRDTAPASFGKLRNITFQALLDEYFQDHKLKAILSLPFLGIGGLPPSMISAFTAAKLYSEFLFDGGYYPTGGMQTLPDVLAVRYKEFGGELLLSTPVKKIAVQDKAIRGVVLDDEVYLPARTVISNCDARQTIFNLLGKEHVDREFQKKLSSMLPSLSNFIVYMGVDDQIMHSYPPGVFLFFLGHYDLKKIYEAARNNEEETYDAYTVRIGHDGATMNAIALASYGTDEYWKHNKLRIQESLLGRLEAGSFSGLSQHIRYKDAATPHTLCRYTSNYQGASFGWAGTPSQFAVPQLRKPSFIQGLYLVGHWTTLGVGISGSAYLGQDTAKMLLRKHNVWDKI